MDATVVYLIFLFQYIIQNFLKSFRLCCYFHTDYVMASNYLYLMFWTHCSRKYCLVNNVWLRNHFEYFGKWTFEYGFEIWKYFLLHKMELISLFGNIHCRSLFMTQLLDNRSILGLDILLTFATLPVLNWLNWLSYHMLHLTFSERWNWPSRHNFYHFF